MREPIILALNPGPTPRLLVSVAERLGVNPITMCSAIRTGKLVGAEKVDGRWHINPGATWTRYPVGTNPNNRARV